MIKVIDLFSGVGGLSFGFAKNDNFKLIAANEILKPMAKAYELNHPNVKMFNSDIADFGINKLNEQLQIKPGEIDLVIGGPPCQAYSTVGKRLLEDPRAKLFLEYSRILEELQPKYFIYENVSGLLSMNKGKLIAEIVELFEKHGYHVKYKLLNAADYGAPQIRKRVIVFGSKIDNNFEYPEPTHSGDSNMFLKPYLTLGEALSDLPLIGNGEAATHYQHEPQNSYQKKMRENSSGLLEDHSSAVNNKNLLKIMQHLPEGGTPKDLPDDLKPKSGFGNTYSRLWWDKPSTTITRNLGTPSSSRCIHPKVPRALTTREGARLQGFPDNFKFYGSRSDRNLQIGNAVPTMLSEALSQSVFEYINNR